MTSQRNIPPITAQRPGFVRVRGAREHNLRNVDVDIPRDALVVFTGVSGSGKSSLAFSTVYAEAQRRYFESVAPYARRLIDQVGVPDVDSIEGLPPAVALQQQRGTPSARSSVGSVTTLSSLIRMLYSRAGSYPPGQAMLYAEDFSPNLPQGACPHCHGLGRVYEVTEALMVPDPSLTIRQRAVAAWPLAWQGQNLRDILVTLGYDVDIPWRDLPKKQRDWILFTEETPTVPVYAGFTPAQTRDALKRKLEPSYQGTFSGARRYILHTFAHTQSALMKKRVSQFMQGSACPLCEGKRLTRAALSVKFAGVDIGELSQLSLTRLAELLRPVAAGQDKMKLSVEKRLAAQRIAGLRRGEACVHRDGRGFFGEQDPVALLFRQVTPGDIHVVAQRHQNVAQVLALPRQRPGRHGALADGQRRVRHHQRLGHFIHPAQAMALRTRALGKVRREVLGIQHRLSRRIAASTGVQHADQARQRRHAAHRRARTRRTALLLQGHGGRQAFDAVHVRHTDLVDQPSRIRRHRLEITPLRFGIHRGKRQGRLAGARYAGKHHQGIPRNIHVDVTQVVFAGATHPHKAGELRDVAL